ncbi:hypothetical protein [Fontivita pretiosa]|uniref:hypothetical protein n=1 Tax=Fontivita pretiosa TaxID=2989684 RepID=UPI003D1766A9
MARNLDPDGNSPRDFPLSLASNGQYCKKYKGRRYNFGSVKAGWKAALKRFYQEWSYIVRGEQLPPTSTDGIPPTSWECVAREFLAREFRRTERHQLSLGSFIDIRNAIEIAVTSVGKTTNVNAMTPEDWATLRHNLSLFWRKTEGSNGSKVTWTRTQKRVSVDCHKRRIVHVRAMMRWASIHQAVPGVLPPRYGDEFHLPSKAAIRLARTTKTIQHGFKRWEPDQIARIRAHLAAPSPTALQLHTMFLLSLLLGYTATDCACLAWQMIDFDNHIIRFPRIKTGVDRIGYMTPLVEHYLRMVRHLHLSPAPALADEIQHQYRDEGGHPIGTPIRVQDLVFLKPESGRPWARRVVKYDASGIPVTEVHYDSIAYWFNTVTKALGLKRPGLTFGTGRHTFESHALRCADKSLVDFVMGHATPHISGWYDHPPVEDLRSLAYAVSDRLGLLDAKEVRPCSTTATGTVPSLA